MKWLFDRFAVLLTALIAVAPVAAQFNYGSQPGYNPITGQGSIQAQNNFVSFGTSGFDGIYINDFLGANRFYTNGSTGSNSVIANIEAGYMAGNAAGLAGVDGGLYAGGHQTLSHVNVFFASNTNPQSTVNLIDRHATWVGHAIGGRFTGTGTPQVRQGIAYNATQWTGAVATSWSGATGYRLNFNIATNGDFLRPYRGALLNDSPGTLSTTLTGTAHVINSSWGYSDPTGSAFGDFSRGVDALTYARGVGGNAAAVVFSAGNSGLGDGTVGGSTVGGPAAGYNVISVGALGADPTYDTVSSFSSRGPMPVFVPLVANVTNINNPAQGTIINSARGRVDISAPGQQLTLAYYGGTTGGNQAPSEIGTPNGGTGNFSFNTAGTSFAAPTVAGGLGLLVDKGVSQLAGANNALDGRVLKAVLLNSADKTSGWSNAATGAGVIGNPYLTTQGLDRNTGAGRMNLDRAFDQYLSGTTGVVSPSGGSVQNRGWAYGLVSQTSTTSDYSFNQSLNAGTQFDATLSFFVNRSVNASNVTLEQRFDNLDLEIYQLSGIGGAILPGNLVARSNTTYDTTEHIFFTIPATGFYALRVLWNGTLWNFTGTTGANFGVAWSSFTPVPEPGGIIALTMGVLVIWRRARSRSTPIEPVLNPPQ